jgi:predicted nucleotidyltransferase
MMKTTPQNISPILQELQEALRNFYGDRLSNLILFGSQARHESTVGSDIDILLILKCEISPGDEILRLSALKTDLNLKYNELIAIVPVSETDYKNRPTPLLENIRREGILL